MIPGAKVSGTIFGINGKAYDVNQLSFDSETYHFFYGPSEIDVTDDLKFSDKLLLVPDFNQDTELYRVSAERGAGRGKDGGIQPLNESTASIFWDQITTDPLAAPLESAERQIDNLLKNAGFRKIALLALLGVGIYIAVKRAGNP